MSGPVTRALKGSYLAPAIRPGLQALTGAERTHVAEPVRAEFADSLDLDEATRERHRDDKRWDFLLGHAPSARVVALEAHPAETSHVSVVIAKREASLRHLNGQLADGVRVAAWFWAASGRVDFVPHEKIILRLAQHGIQFVGGSVEARHLADLAKRAPSPPPRRGRAQRKKPGSDR